MTLFFYHIHQTAAFVVNAYMCGALATPSQFGGTGGNRVSAIAPFERATVVSYGLSIVTIVLSLTIRLQFAIECLQYTSQHGQNLGRKGWTGSDVNQIFNTIWEKSRQCLQLFEHNAET